MWRGNCAVHFRYIRRDGFGHSKHQTWAGQGRYSVVIRVRKVSKVQLSSLAALTADEKEGTTLARSARCRRPLIQVLR